MKSVKMLKYEVLMKSSHKLKFERSKCIHSIKQLLINIKLEFYVKLRFRYSRCCLDLEIWGNSLQADKYA